MQIQTKDLQIKELTERIVLLEQEANNFAVEFQKYEITFEKDQKMKEDQIAQLHKEVESLNETLVEKEQETQLLKSYKAQDRV